MKLINPPITVVCFSYLLITGCSKLAGITVGIKSIKEVDEKTIIKYARKYSIPEADCYQIDTAYSGYLLSGDTVNRKTEIHNHYQPLQVIYYNSSGNIESYHINCKTGGFPNLDWNRNDNFAVFPPKQQTEIDSLVPLSAQLRHLLPLPKTTHIEVADYEYTVIVYWCRFMGRQSRRLIKTVQDNCRLASDKKVKVLYVNADNLFAGKL